ncbi:ribonuclease E [Buchnera aphidicola]|uniref:ribonuclease E n=1 Tax=Buchnera aphidicola TaxID=9 RepID=UPI0034648988
MKRMLINATQEEELRVALVDGQRLYDLNIESSGFKQKKSNIYKGKITRIELSLEAVFVDYGAEKNGFLPFKDICKECFFVDTVPPKDFNITKFLKEGQEIIIQIDKEERGRKGAALTTFISLAGSYLVLLPNNLNLYGVSRRIEGNDRFMLKEALLSLNIPKSMGVIIRTSSLGQSVKSLQLDLSILLNKWNTIKKIAKKKIAPSLIYQESNIIFRAFRDYLRKDIGEILIDNVKILNLAHEHMIVLGRVEFLKKIKLYTGSVPLFSYYQIESQIHSAYQRKVRLPSGGSIIVDSTEALTAIDINSSRSKKGADIESTAFNTNLEAVYEISRQLRLRDLGGLIVIDFIDMSPINHQKTIEDRLREVVREDRARVQVGKISQFGLLEMSRQRLSSSLGESSHHICPRCQGTGAIRDNESLSLSILRLIEEEALKNNTYEVHAIVPIEIACYLLNEKRNEVYAIEKRQSGGKTIIIPNKNMKTPHYSVFRTKKGEMTRSMSYDRVQCRNNNITSYIKKDFLEKKNKENCLINNFHTKNNNYEDITIQKEHGFIHDNYFLTIFRYLSYYKVTIRKIVSWVKNFFLIKNIFFNKKKILLPDSIYSKNFNISTMVLNDKNINNNIYRKKMRYHFLYDIYLNIKKNYIFFQIKKIKEKYQIFLRKPIKKNIFNQYYIKNIKLKNYLLFEYQNSREKFYLNDTVDFHSFIPCSRIDQKSNFFRIGTPQYGYKNSDIICSSITVITKRLLKELSLNTSYNNNLLIMLNRKISNSITINPKKLKSQSILINDKLFIKNNIFFIMLYQRIFFSYHFSQIKKYKDYINVHKNHFIESNIKKYYLHNKKFITTEEKNKRYIEKRRFFFDTSIKEKNQIQQASAPVTKVSNAVAYSKNKSIMHSKLLITKPYRKIKIFSKAYNTKNHSYSPIKKIK